MQHIDIKDTKKSDIVLIECFNNGMGSDISIGRIVKSSEEYIELWPAWIEEKLSNKKELHTKKINIKMSTDNIKQILLLGKYNE